MKEIFVFVSNFQVGLKIQANLQFELLVLVHGQVAQLDFKEAMFGMYKLLQKLEASRFGIVLHSIKGMTLSQINRITNSDK